MVSSPSAAACFPLWLKNALNSTYQINSEDSNYCYNYDYTSGVLTTGGLNTFAECPPTRKWSALRVAEFFGWCALTCWLPGTVACVQCTDGWTLNGESQLCEAQVAVPITYGGCNTQNTAPCAATQDLYASFDINYQENLLTW